MSDLWVNAILPYGACGLCFLYFFLSLPSLLRMNRAEGTEKKRQERDKEIARLEKLNQKLIEEYEEIDNPKPLFVGNDFLTPALWDRGYYRYSPHKTECKCQNCTIKGIRHSHIDSYIQNLTKIRAGWND